MSFETELSKVNWKDIAILEIVPFDENLILIVLIFDTHDEGKHFVRQILAHNEFGLAATTDKDGLYEFYINFIQYDHIGLLRPTIIPKDQYKFKEWHEQGKIFAITNGIWVAGMERLFDYGDCGMVIVDKIFFD